MDGMPTPEDVLPAVEHVMGTLDHDAGRIQGIADRLYQTVGASLDSDKQAVASLRGKLKRAVSKSVIKQDGANLTDLAQVMRSAVAKSVDADEQRMEPLQRKLAAALAPHGITPEQLQAGFRPGTTRPPTVDPPRPVVPAIPPHITVPGGGASSDICFPAPVNAPFDTWNVWCRPDGTAYAAPNCRGHNGPLDTWKGNYYSQAVAEQVARETSCGPGAVRPPGTPPAPPVPAPPPQPAPPPAPAPIVVPPPSPPGPVPASAACGPLPTALPGVRVYVVPWLDPGDTSPSALSECGRKLIADAMYRVCPAQPIADALSRSYGYVDVVPDLDEMPDGQDLNISLGAE